MPERTYSEEFVNQFASAEFRHGFMADQTRVRIAMLVRVNREARGWSQAELGKRMRKPQSVVSRIENPDYGKLNLKTLLQVAAALDLPLFIDLPNWPSFFDQTREWSDASLRRDSFDAAQFNAKPPAVTSGTDVPGTPEAENQSPTVREGAGR